jgi:hypothetical protein
MCDGSVSFVSFIPITISKTQISTFNGVTFALALCWTDSRKTIGTFARHRPHAPASGESASAIDKVRSALGNEYIKPLHYAVGHLRRAADWALRPKQEGSACNLDLLAVGESRRVLTEQYFSNLQPCPDSNVLTICLQAHPEQNRPLVRMGITKRLANRFLPSAPNFCRPLMPRSTSSCLLRQTCTAFTCFHLIRLILNYYTYLSRIRLSN